MREVDNLKKNTLILGVATVGSRGISFILAPIYSYFLTTSEFGLMDLITTTIGLLAPIVVADSYEATFRFASDKNQNQKSIISNSFIIAFIGIIVMYIILGIAYPFYYKNMVNVIFSSVFIVINGITSIVGEFARGIGKIKTYAFSGFISAFLQLILSIIFMIYFKMGLFGWLLTYLIAQLITLLYLLVSIKIYKYFKKSDINKSTIIFLLKYCLPMIPTTIMWWIMNVSDRYVINLYLGTKMNGIYAVSNKIPAIISVLDIVFYQAWQTSAINSLNNTDRNKFYSSVFNNFLSFIIIGYLGILLISKPIIGVFSSGYQSAYLLIPPLLAGAVIHSLGSHLGSYYTVFCNTIGALNTATIGAVVNIVLNFVFIKQYGLLAAALTTLLGYAVTLVFRWKDIKKYVHIELKIETAFFAVCLCILQTIVYYNNTFLSYVIMIGINCVYLFINRKMIKKMLFQKIGRNR